MGPAGLIARLCNTLVVAASMAAVSESLAVGKRLGVDSKVLTQVSRVQMRRADGLQCKGQGKVPGDEGAKQVDSKMMASVPALVSKWPE